MDDVVIANRLKYILDHQLDVRAELQEVKATLLELRASVAELRIESGELRRRLIQETAKPPAT